MINYYIITSNPFLEAYSQSDLLGKLIFIGLLALSICSWIILIHKFWINRKAQSSAIQFQRAFSLQKMTPLALDADKAPQDSQPHPFRTLYAILKKNTLELLNKNRHFSEKGSNPYLTEADIDYIEGHLATGIAQETKDLEKNLFILATVVSLGPFLGLLGTVWGILTTFADMQTQTGGNTHQAVLGGLSLALATTVLGLVDAIPALIGYNYLKNSVRDFQTEMEGFSQEILSSVEMQYRKVGKD